MKKRIKKLLESTNLQDQPGSIIYSADSTLKKGDFYFLGTNPGGKKQGYADTILNQVRLSGEMNEYTDGNWTNPEHQNTIKSMFENFGIDLKVTFSTNASFIRSPGEQKYQPRYPINEENIKAKSKAIKQLKKDAEDTFWPMQEYFLSIVRPKLIIANDPFGVGTRIAFAVNLLDKSGITLVTALPAPVDVITILIAADLPLRLLACILSSKF